MRQLSLKILAIFANVSRIYSDKLIWKVLSAKSLKLRGMVKKVSDTGQKFWLKCRKIDKYINLFK